MIANHSNIARSQEMPEHRNQLAFKPVKGANRMQKEFQHTLDVWVVLYFERKRDPKQKELRRPGAAWGGGCQVNLCMFGVVTLTAC